MSTSFLLDFGVGAEETHSRLHQLKYLQRRWVPDAFIFQQLERLFDQVSTGLVLLLGKQH
jgi:hypothetical protein